MHKVSKALYQAQPTFNTMGNNNNNNGSPMCTMVKEDLMKIITDSGYGQTNPAMFNMYFQQGSSPPIMSRLYEAFAKPSIKTANE